MITADPGDVSLDADRLTRVDALTHGYVDAGRFPGVITVIARRGEVVHHDVYGQADLRSGRALTDDSIFRIYSMTKPITSIGLMMLYEEGKVLLENPVSRFIPAFADTQVWDSGTEADHSTVAPGREMNVHDVLTHMSGITAGFHFQHPVDALYRSQGVGDLVRPTEPLSTVMDKLAGLPLLFSPGTAWAYGASTDVVGRIIEVIADQPLDEYLRERILEPLGMVDTDFWVTPDRMDRFTTNYIRGPGRRLKAIDSAERTTYDEQPAYFSGAGGLVSTAADYQRFVTMLRNGGRYDDGRLVGPRTLAYMASNHLPGGKTLNEMGQTTFAEVAMEGTGFGLGFSVILDPAAVTSISSVGEFGWGGAASTAFWVDPVEDLTVLFLTQLLPSATYPIRRQLRAAIYQAIID